MDWKKALHKVWFFIWEEDSIWSWIVNVILAFVIIKFLLYPGLGFVLGTPAPIVAVVSGSMEHQGDFDAWWDEPSCCDELCSTKNIQSSYYTDLDLSKSVFRDFPFVNGFNKGDIMFLVGPDNVEVGDVIVYQVSHRADPIIHRVVSMKDGAFTTKGDHNCGIASFEQDIPADKVIGKAFWRLPFLGWVKIIFVDFINLFAR